jgi:hypothetical protein
MLLDPQGNKLGDRNVKDAESVARLRENIRATTDKKKIPNQALLEDQDMAIGEPMSPQLFIEKLRKFPGVIVEQGGIPNAVAVRMLVTDEDPTSETHGKQIKRYVSGFYVDRVLPEFSSVTTNEHGLATREIRGWRSVLLALFNSKAVTLKQLKAAFGDANGQRGTLWQQRMQAAR